MRTVFLILWIPLAAGQSNPSWWGLASPEASALVGIEWENLRQSVFAGAVGAELSSSGSLKFPDLPIVKEARQILISSPALLAIASGAFPSATVQKQAAANGLKPVQYCGIDEWISPNDSTLGVAQWSGQLLLIGARETLESAIDRGLEPERRYSPLLARAAGFASRDLWVVANRLPDPLANVFVPLEVEARGFEGAVSVRDGLRLEASIEAESAQSAAAIAEDLRKSIPSWPIVARGLAVSTDGNSVSLALQVDREQLARGMRPTEAPIPAEKPEASKPRIIRILGLDEGPREIVLPPPEQGAHR